jgi:uncharacterized protein YkwD
VLVRLSALLRTSARAPRALAACLVALAMSPAPSAHAQKSADVAATAKRVVERTNAFRGQRALRPVATNGQLEDAARRFARFMAENDRIAHTADGRSPEERVRAAGYEYCIVLENLASQFSSAGFTATELADRLMQGWIDSPPHRRNLADADVTEIGVAVARSARTDKYYAVQLFGRQRRDAVEFTLLNESGTAVRYAIDAESFVLEPRQGRRHRSCREARVSLALGAGEPVELRPRGGEQYRIARTAQGRLAVTGAR